MNVNGIHIFSIVATDSFGTFHLLKLRRNSWLRRMNEAITSDGDQTSTERCSQGLRGHTDDKWWPGKGEHECFPATCALMLKVNTFSPILNRPSCGNHDDVYWLMRMFPEERRRKYKNYFVRKLLCVLCETHLSLETEGDAVSSTADKVWY